MQNCSNPEIAEENVNSLYVSLSRQAEKMQSAIMASLMVETAEWRSVRVVCRWPLLTAQVAGVSRTTWSNPGPNAHTVTTDAAMKVRKATARHSIFRHGSISSAQPVGIMAIGNLFG